MNVFISTTSFGEYDDNALKALRNKGFNVQLNPYHRKMKPEELVDLAKDCEGLIAGTETIGEDALGKLPRLKVISRCGTGLENVDLDAAKRLGIRVFNTPDAPTIAVAELTVGLILNMLRKIGQMTDVTKSGGWSKMMGNLLAGKNVGIIGFGRIGRKVAMLLKAFNCSIAYTDTFVSNGSIDAVVQKEKSELIKWADIITIHVSTRERVMGKNELYLMKKRAWLVNTSRGDVIDETVLYEMLKAGSLSGAALDVFQQEPYYGPLKTLNNVILTPHIGSYAIESRVEMEMDAVKNIIKILNEVAK